MLKWPVLLLHYFTYILLIIHMYFYLIRIFHAGLLLGVFLHCHIGTFTEVTGLSTYYLLLHNFPTVSLSVQRWRDRNVFAIYLFSSGNSSANAHRGLHMERLPTDLCAAMPVGGPAHGLVAEHGVVPAATAADISELFIKRMTTLSSPISGPSCTGVLLLLSGRVSSILLPCYSLELLMANTIPPFLPGLSRLAVWNQAWWGGSGR